MQNSIGSAANWRTKGIDNDMFSIAKVVIKMDPDLAYFELEQVVESVTRNPLDGGEKDSRTLVREMGKIWRPNATSLHQPTWD